jgi:hypothetical protein
MGDGVLAYFGWPRAHEDEAERAVRAGLAVTTAVAKLTTPDGTALSTRTGIATGLVVVGDLIGEGAAKEQAVVGETPNLAARMQGLAKPGSVVIASDTQRLCGELFELIDLGTRQVKGFTEPLKIWQVVGENKGSSPKAAKGRSYCFPASPVSVNHDLSRLCWERLRPTHPSSYVPMARNITPRAPCIQSLSRLSARPVLPSKTVPRSNSTDLKTCCARRIC